MSRVPAWARWPRDMLETRERHSVIVVTKKGGPFSSYIRRYRLTHMTHLQLTNLVLRYCSQQLEPTFVIDLSRSTCDIAATAETVLGVKVVLSLAQHPSYVEEGAIRMRSATSQQRDRLANSIKSLVPGGAVRIQLPTSNDGESSTEEKYLGPAAPVIIDSLTVRRLSATAQQLREICDRFGLFDKVLKEDMERASNLVKAEYKLFLGLKQTLLTSCCHEGQCIIQLRLIMKSVLGRSFPWIEAANTLADIIDSSNSSDCELIEMTLRRIWFFSELLAWLTQAHFVLTTPSTSQQTADVALRISQIFHPLRERPRNLNQATTLVARITWASKDILSMIASAYNGCTIDGDLRYHMLTIIRSVTSLQDAASKFVLSPPFPFEFDVLVAHAYRVAAFLLETLQTITSQPYLDQLDFDTLRSIEWSSIAATQRYFPPAWKPKIKIPTSPTFSRKASLQKQHAFFEAVGEDEIHASELDESVGEGEQDGDADEDYIFEDFGDPLDEALTSNQRYLRVGNRQLCESRRFLSKAISPEGINRMCIGNVLKNLQAIANQLVCVDTRNSSISNWAQRVSEIYATIQDTLSTFTQLCKATSKRTLDGEEIMDIVASLQQTIVNVDDLLSDLQTVLADQEKFQLQREKNLSTSATHPSSKSHGYVRMGLSKDETNLYGDLDVPEIRVPEATVESEEHAQDEVSDDDDSVYEDLSLHTQSRSPAGIIDDETDVIYLKTDDSQSGSGTSSDKSLAAASLPQLVAKITRGDRFDPKLMHSVILTYHSFTSGQELLNLLIARFEDTLKTVSKKDVEGFKIRIRVLNVLKRWIIDNGEDFRNQDILAQLEAFVEKHSKHPYAEQLSTMIVHLNACKMSCISSIFTSSGARRDPTDLDIFALQGDELEEFEQTGDVSFSPQATSLDLTQLAVRETAEQLTLWHWRQFIRLSPKDLIGKNANKTRTRKALTRYFDVTSSWAMATILSQANKAKRVLKLKYMIRLAEILFSLGNFDLFYAVYLGVTHSSILRLKQTWKTFTDKHKRSSSLFQKHENLCGDQHFGRLRPYFADRQIEGKPCIPVIAMNCGDIVKRDNAFDDIVDHNGLKLINMTKRLNLSQSIEELRRFQRLPYNLPVKEVIQRYLHSGFIQQVQLSPQEAYQRSRQLEPPSS